jgi:hypothetical protein
MSQDNRHHEPSNAETSEKREKEADQQPGSRMETATYIIGVVVLILGLMSAAFSQSANAMQGYGQPVLRLFCRSLVAFVGIKTPVEEGPSCKQTSGAS